MMQISDIKPYVKMSLAMIILVVVIIIALMLTGCAGGKQIQMQSPVITVAPLKPVQAPTITDPIVQLIDQFCYQSEFQKGLFEGYYMGRELSMFTGQQLADIKAFQEFCKKPKADRTMYDYGYITGRVCDSLITGLVPYLGRDAITLLKATGLIF